MEEESDYEVFDEIPFYMNGQGVTNKHRSHLYTYNLDTKKNLFVLQKALLMYPTQKIHDGTLYYTGQKWTKENNLYMKIFISMMVK